MKALFILSFAVLLCGCSGVVLKEPLPETPLSNKEQKALTGTWLLEDSILYLAFTNDGKPKLTSVEWEDNAFQLIEHKVVFSKTNDTIFVSIESNEKDNPAVYYFGEIKTDNSIALVWLPNPDIFEMLVDKGLLSGEITRKKRAKQILINAPGEAVLSLLSTNSAAINYKSPLIFRKIK